MPIIAQHLLIIAAVAGCATFLLRGAYRALHGRKSAIGGCGACGGCATPAKAPEKPVERVVMVSTESLLLARKNRSDTKR